VGEHITHDDLMRYLDGEVSPEERARIDVELTTSTELARDVAVFRAMKNDFQQLSFQPGTHHRSVWDQVNMQVTRPIGWLLVSVGVAVWMIYGAYVFSTTPGDPWAKLGTGAIVIGILMLLSSVIWERYKEWGTDPYRDIQR
jgi:hypothetical protein